MQLSLHSTNKNKGRNTLKKLTYDEFAKIDISELFEKYIHGAFEYTDALPLKDRLSLNITARDYIWDNNGVYEFNPTKFEVITLLHWLTEYTNAMETLDFDMYTLSYTEIVDALYKLLSIYKEPTNLESFLNNMNISMSAVATGMTIDRCLNSASDTELGRLDTMYRDIESVNSDIENMLKVIEEFNENIGGE